MIMTMTNLQIDKLNGPIAFNEEFHKYFNIKNPEYQYTSVTTLIGKYHETFDSEFFSKYKALERILGEEFKDYKPFLLDNKKRFPLERWMIYIEQFDFTWEEFMAVVDSILEDWNRNTKEACDRGTAFHLERENEWYEKYNELVRVRTPVSGDFVCQKHNFDLEREKAVIPEFLVYYSCPENILHLAGQVDLLIKDGNDIYILDYKTNAKGIKDKAFFDKKRKSTIKMNYPINTLEDTVLNHYTLQLSIYAFMLKRIKPEFNIKMLKLIHIDLDGNETEIEVPYLEKEVVRLLKFHKKSILIEKERQLNEGGPY